MIPPEAPFEILKLVKVASCKVILVLTLNPRNTCVGAHEIEISDPMMRLEPKGLDTRIPFSKMDASRLLMVLWYNDRSNPKSPA